MAGILALIMGLIANKKIRDQFKKKSKSVEKEIVLGKTELKIPDRVIEKLNLKLGDKIIVKILQKMEDVKDKS